MSSLFYTENHQHFYAEYAVLLLKSESNIKFQKEEVCGMADEEQYIINVAGSR